MVVIKLVVKEPSENRKSRQLFPTPAIVRPIAIKKRQKFKWNMKKTKQDTIPIHTHSHAQIHKNKHKYIYISVYLGEYCVRACMCILNFGDTDTGPLLVACCTLHTNQSAFYLIFLRYLKK